MPFTTLDDRSALILVDLQKGILGYDTVHPTQDVVARAAELAAAFRARELPVVLVNVKGGAPGRTETPRRQGTPPSDWADFADELDRQPGDIAVTKMTWGAFHDTPLHEHLTELGVTQVVLGGVSTSIGVETTARSAFEHGYHVSLVTDAMTDTDPVLHDNSVGRIFPRLGETGTTQELLALLDAR